MQFFDWGGLLRFFGRGVGDKVLEGKVLTGEARSGWGTASMQGLGWQGVQGFFFQTRSAFKQTHKNEQRIVLKWGCGGVWGGGCLFFQILGAQTAVCQGW